MKRMLRSISIHWETEKHSRELEENTWDANEKDASIDIHSERETRVKWESPHGALYRAQLGLQCSFSLFLAFSGDRGAWTMPRSKLSQTYSYSIWVILWFAFHFHGLFLNCISRGMWIQCVWMYFLSLYNAKPIWRTWTACQIVNQSTAVIKCRAAVSSAFPRFMKKRFWNTADVQ